MSIESAFNFLIGLQGRPMSLEKADFSSSITIEAAVSNYFRDLAGPEETSIEGQEFVIRKADLGEFGTPQRGDRLIDPEIGESVLTVIRPMISLGGNIIGYRLRSS